MPAISVIIPVYNTEQFIGRCLDSVQGQTFMDLEILCIDDGSTDETPEILRRYAGQDSRIRVITLPENHGVPYARNLAIDEAVGEYLYYMDSDDWLDLDYLEEMYRHAVASGQDVVINSNWYFEYANSRKSSGELNPEFNLKEPTYFSTVFIQSSFYPVVWARLYRLSYLRDNNIRSPQVKGGVDDNCFTSLAEVLQPKSYVFSGPFYHYYQRPGSLSRQGELALHYTHAFDALLKEIKKREIPPYAAKRFYVIPQLVIKDENTFDSMRSFFAEVEPDMFESLGLYMYHDFRSLEIVLNCPDYKTFISRYPFGLAIRSSVEWETGRMVEIMSRIPSTIVEQLPAKELLSPLRFDLFSYMLYIKNRREMPGLCKRVIREISRSSIIKRDKSREKQEEKTIDARIADFEKLLVNMGDNSVDDYRIPVGKWPVPLDGTHIVAAASFYDREVSVFKLASSDKGLNDYSICLDHGMSRLVADLSAREGVDWVKCPKIICFWSCVKSDHACPGDILYSREFNLGPISYSRLRARIFPGPVKMRIWSRVKFVFCSGFDFTVEGDDYQVIEDVMEVKKVSDLLLTWRGRKEWYHGGGFLCCLTEPLEKFYDHCRTEFGWKGFWIKRFFTVIVKKAKGKLRKVFRTVPS